MQAKVLSWEHVGASAWAGSNVHETHFSSSAVQKKEEEQEEMDTSSLHDDDSSVTKDMPPPPAPVARGLGKSLARMAPPPPPKLPPSRGKGLMYLPHPPPESSESSSEEEEEAEQDTASTQAPDQEDAVSLVPEEEQVGETSSLAEGAQTLQQFAMGKGLAGRLHAAQKQADKVEDGDDNDDDLPAPKDETRFEDGRRCQTRNGYVSYSMMNAHYFDPLAHGQYLGPLTAAAEFACLYKGREQEKDPVVIKGLRFDGLKLIEGMVDFALQKLELGPKYEDMPGRPSVATSLWEIYLWADRALKRNVFLSTVLTTVLYNFDQYVANLGLAHPTALILKSVYRLPWTFDGKSKQSGKVRTGEEDWQLPVASEEEGDETEIKARKEHKALNAGAVLLKRVQEHWTSILESDQPTPDFPFTHVLEPSFLPVTEITREIIEEHILNACPIVREEGKAKSAWVRHDPTNDFDRWVKHALMNILVSLMPCNDYARANAQPRDTSGILKTMHNVFAHISLFLTTRGPLNHVSWHARCQLLWTLLEIAMARLCSQYGPRTARIQENKQTYRQHCRSLYNLYEARHKSMVAVLALYHAVYFVANLAHTGAPPIMINLDVHESKHASIISSEMKAMDSNSYLDALLPRAYSEGMNYHVYTKPPRARKNKGYDEIMHRAHPRGKSKKADKEDSATKVAKPRKPRKPRVSKTESEQASSKNTKRKNSAAAANKTKQPKKAKVSSEDEGETRKTGKKTAQETS